MNRLSEFNDELLSAYLDGELTVEERAAVEARLLQDADAQELVGELRAAAHAVRELPRVKAPHDLRDVILRAAAERVDADGSDGTSGPTSPAPTARGPAWTIGRSPRGWIWGAAATAAALMIMVLSGDGDHERDLARQQGESPATGRAGDLQAAASGERPETADESDLRRRELRSTRPTDADARGVERSRGPFPAENGVRRGLREEAAPDVEVLASGGESEDAAVPGELLERNGGGADEFWDVEGAGTSEQFYVWNPGDASGSEAEVILDNPDAAFRSPEVADSADAPVYFVSVNVTPDAVRNRAVSEYFGRNSIAFAAADPAARPAGAEALSLGLQPALDASEDAELQQERRAALAGAASRTAESAPAGGAAADIGPVEVERLTRAFTAEEAEVDPADDQATPVSEVVAVEAPPERIAALLADLSADRHNVRALAVLAQAGGVDTAGLESPARFNRNVEEAVSQVAGRWRFESGKAVAQTAISDESVVGGGYGRGYGGGYGGAGRHDLEVLAGAGNADAFEAAPEPGRGGYGATQDGRTDATASRDNWPAPAQAQASREGVTRRVGEVEVRQRVDGLDLETFGKRRAISGQAWVVSPFQVRSLPREQTLQEQFRERQHDSRDGGRPAASRPDEPTRAGRLPKPARDQAEALVEENVGALPAGPAAGPEDRDSVGRSRKGGVEFNFHAPPPRADSPSPGEDAAPASPTASPSAGTIAQPDEGQQQLQAGGQVAQADASALPKQVRMVLFFNVVPSPAMSAVPPPDVAVEKED